MTVVATLDASFGRLQGCSGQDANHGHSHLVVAHTHTPRFYSIMPMNSGKDFKAREVDVAQPLMAGGPVGGNQGGDFVVQSVALRGRDGGATAELGGEAAYALRAAAGGGSDPYVLAPATVLPFDTTQLTSPSNYSNPNYGDPCHPLAAGAHPPAVCVTGSVTHTLKAEGFDASEDGTGRGQPIVVHGTQDPDVNIDFAHTHTLGRNSGQENALFGATMAVRRLMPIECHYLQGFPGDWCAVPTGPKGDKIAADGPQYKQLGNSWAVNHAHWVGYRIALWLAANPPRPVIEMHFDEATRIWMTAA